MWRTGRITEGPTLRASLICGMLHLRPLMRTIPLEVFPGTGLATSVVRKDGSPTFLALVVPLPHYFSPQAAGGFLMITSPQGSFQRDDLHLGHFFMARAADNTTSRVATCPNGDLGDQVCPHLSHCKAQAKSLIMPMVLILTTGPVPIRCLALSAPYRVPLFTRPLMTTS